MTNSDYVKEATKILLVIQGGIGRNISATAVIRALKKAYPEKQIDVIAGVPEIFLKNPKVGRVHNLSQPTHIYEDYILQKFPVFFEEPYQHPGYYTQQTHFIECWCDKLGIPMDGIEPEIFYNFGEVEMAKDYLGKFKRRMVLFQHQGGKIPAQPTKKEKLIAKSGMYRRSLPENVAQEVTDALINAGYMVGSIGDKNQFLPKGAEQINFPIRAITALVPFVEAVITIDSFLLHASACFKEKTPVLAVWGGTNPNILGYPWHKNIARRVCATPMCHRPNSYLFDFEMNGYLWDCPHNDICMNFTAEEIINAFKSMMKEAGKDEPTRADQSTGATEAGKNGAVENKPCEKTGLPCDCKGDPEPEVSASIGAN